MLKGIQRIWKRFQNLGSSAKDRRTSDHRVVASALRLTREHAQSCSCLTGSPELSASESYWSDPFMAKLNRNLDAAGKVLGMDVASRPDQTVVTIINEQGEVQGYGPEWACAKYGTLGYVYADCPNCRKVFEACMDAKKQRFNGRRCAPLA